VLALALVGGLTLHLHLIREDPGQRGQALALPLGVRRHHALAHSLHPARSVGRQGDPLLGNLGTLQGDTLPVLAKLSPHRGKLFALEPKRLFDDRRYRRLWRVGRALVDGTGAERRVVTAHALSELGPVGSSSAVQGATNKLTADRLTVHDQGGAELAHELVEPAAGADTTDVLGSTLDLQPDGKLLHLRHGGGVLPQRRRHGAANRRRPGRRAAVLDAIAGRVATDGPGPVQRLHVVVVEHRGLCLIAILCLFVGGRLQR